MADRHNDHLADGSEHPPPDAMPTLGDTAIGQAASEVASEAHADNARAPAKPKSGIWEHYDRLPSRNGNKMAKCRYCPREYVLANSGTGNMWRHTRKVHPSMIGGQPGAESGDPMYTPQALREALVHWIVTRDQPFSEVDDPSFRKVLRMLRPDAQVPSSDTARRDIVKRFGDEKRRARAVLQAAPGRLSFAVDAWTSPSMQAFLGITVHWIDAEWRLRGVLLDIPPLSGRHTGENLCTTFVGACHGFGVLPKLLAITTDSASNNDTFLEALETVCLQGDVAFNRSSQHVRCIAHVINLAVQDFLRTLGAAALASEDAYDESYIPDTATAGFIPRLRKMVVKVRESPQRRERFAHQCKLEGVHPKELVVDVRTRWNSTHDMIKRALELRGPLDKFAAVESDLVRYKMKPEEWRLLESVCGFLRAFKLATKRMCSASHPTLATAVPAYNFLLDKLEDYRDANPGLETIEAATNAAINKLKVYYCKAGAEIYPVATILDPRYKLGYYHDHDWEQEWIQEAQTAFNRAFARYRAPPAPAVREGMPTQLGSGNGGNDDDDDDDDDEDEDVDVVKWSILKRRRVAERDEVEEYLTAPRAMPETDVLQWWKVNAAAYPRLAAMARDYLAIPATSAPVERVFSGGTDLVQPKRGALSGDAIHACLCLKSWLKLSQ